MANASSMWIGLKSPEAPAYRTVTYGSGVISSSIGSLTMFLHSAVQTVSPRWFSDTDSNTENPIPPRGIRS